MARAIWRTTSITDSSDGAKLEVKVNGELVYSGVMNIPPGEDEWNFDAQPIVKNYVEVKWPSLQTSGTAVSTVAEVEVIADGNVLYSESFYPDWSYDPSHDVYALADPIDGVIDRRMKLPYSFASESSKSVTAIITLGDGTTTSVESPTLNAGTFSVDLSAYPDATKVDIEGHTYKVLSTCKRYAIYYQNAYGGWDAFVPQGRQIRTDNYTRQEFTRHTSTSFHLRDRVNYDTLVAPGWSLSTGALSDDAADRMHHLVGSPNVYVLDMETGTYYAAIVKTSSCSYLTAKNNGRQFPTYTIEVELAKDQHRR